ncbi:uncharacterized protein LOC112455176 [Temnothorax curvispinosus]|uniref:Uncharacterized protein LOC112455176 n=1 Tax=Temnothorax curvispinosus TaxID=300111 RepID=A0A6J1PTT2_9HYME|nr:uncharacterized protein LOC112455176 [Temnothorax curvispinosus]
MSMRRSPARRHRHRHHHRRDHCPAIAGCFAVIEDFFHKCIDRANLRRRHRHRHRLHRRRSAMMEESVADLLKNWGFEKFVSIFEDESPVTILHKFAKLFEPVILNARIGKFKTRPTRAEIAEGLVLHVKVIDDLMPAINRMRLKAEQLKTTLQPLAAVVGLKI